MATIVTIVTCEVDGHAIAGSPFVFEMEAQQYAMVNVQKPQDAAGVYALIPCTHGAFPIITAMLLFNVDEAVAYRLQGQLNSNIPLGADGMMLIMGSSMSLGDPNLKANSPDGICSVLGFVAGKGLPLVPPTNLLIDERWEASYPTPGTQVTDERWEADYPTPGALVVDERWEGGTCPTPTVLLIDERWEVIVCTPSILVSEGWETLFCDNSPGAGFATEVSEQWEVGFCTPFTIFVDEQWED